MDNRTILVMQGTKGKPQDLAGVADAAVDIDGRLHVLQIGNIPPVPAYMFDAYSSPDGWDETRRAMADHLGVQAIATAAYLATKGVIAETDVLYDSALEIGHRIIPFTFMADVAVMLDGLRQDPDVFSSLSYGVIFHSPIPLILNPTDAALTPKRVLIAWNESRPAARAMHAALPILRAAQDVTLCNIDPLKGQEDICISIAAWLSHHGCKVSVQQVPSSGSPVAEVILRRANEVGADLIVMGAYGHTRMRQRIFGGTTHSIIDQTRQAVFLAH